MRVYVATKVSLLKELVDGKEVTFEEYLAPEQFEFASGVDEEEQEHLISQLAADDSFEMNQGKEAYVLALELHEEQLNGEAITVDFGQVAALLKSEDGEELSWFAPEEIKFNLLEWISQQ